MQLHPDMANIEVDLSVFGDGFVKMSPQHHDGVAGIVEGYFRRPYSPSGTALRLIDACKADFLHIQGGFAVARPPELICQHQRNRNKRHCQQRPHQDCQFAFHDLPPRYSLTYSHMFSKSHGGAEPPAPLAEELLVWSVHL